ncbi:GNAT family N-acetyltransferase [Bacillus marinisedimentorum]|uniref:GNAT family N-acetyltransferase n=1 Tax=Bacillus marinisedimentorum TaxID=1821260 RepID=UPI00087242C7|nr:GNAT family N-acetyltransferase [Bacillus marinisedimentorum]
MDVRLVQTDSELEDAFEVRKIVFVDEQNVPVEEEIDQYEEDSVHFVAYDASKPVAAGRLRILEDTGKVERICVLADYRKTGLGKQVMEAIEQHAAELGASTAKLNAQTHAEAFYGKLGYETVSGLFMDAGIPHVTMVKKLK